jgi:hypothetical protein
MEEQYELYVMDEIELKKYLKSNVNDPEKVNDIIKMINRIKVMHECDVIESIVELFKYNLDEFEKQTIQDLKNTLKLEEEGY